MPKINILPDSLINKIAAGEVIERPASVVKELLENSIDANSNQIKIEIEQAGKKKIKITDNGDGMTTEDVLLCFKRHATSKINDEQDLFNINSLGFRGEALASIAEISNLKITTKTQDSSQAIQIEIEAGKILKQRPTGSPKGTIIEINDLFFNVPARQKYLKSDEVELNHIIKVVTKYALINKQISIKLIHNKKEIINSPKTDSLLNNIIFIYGAEIGKNLLEVNYNNNGIILNGYISKPSLTRADKTDQSLYLNNRYIRNDLISNTIYNAYHTLLFINRHPIFVLNLNIDPSQVDVNVHPAKSIVRLKHEDIIEKEIFAAIRQTFENNNLISDVSLDSEAHHTPIKDYAFTKDRQQTLEVKEDTSDYKTAKDIQETEQAAAYSQHAVPGKQRAVSLGPFLILGQINKTYIIAENPEGLAIIDQHAAQERVNYEKFMSQLKDKAIKKQRLVKTKLLELNPAQYNIANNNKKLIESLGFEYEDFGNNSIKLISIPEIFGRLKSTLFLDILNELSNRSIDQEIEERIIRFACRASVKAGDELTKPEMQQLIKDLEKTSNPYSCPHGRPTIINLSIADLEKKFKRVGW